MLFLHNFYIHAQIYVYLHLYILTGCNILGISVGFGFVCGVPLGVGISSLYGFNASLYLGTYVYAVYIRILMSLV